MTVERMIELLEIEKECVLRNGSGECNRYCAGCDLLQDDTELHEMYTEAIALLKEQEAVDAAPVVRCAYCKHCYDMGSDLMEPYDGESEWYCARFDRDTSAYEIDPYRFFCADGERRDSE